MDKKKYRLNLYKQMTDFSRIVISQKCDFKYYHVLIYDKLLVQNYRSDWSEEFKFPLDLALNLTLLCKKTYYKGIRELDKLGIIKYIPGENHLRAARFKLFRLDTWTPPHTPAGTPADTPPHTPADTPVNNNIKSIIDNSELLKEKHTKKEMCVCVENLNNKNEISGEQKRLDELWEDYCLVRKKRGKGFLNSRIENAKYAELAKLGNNDIKMIIKILEHTTANSWLKFVKPGN